MVTFSLDDRLLAAYLFYGAILLLKMLLMSFITAFHRIKNKVWSFFKTIFLLRDLIVFRFEFMMAGSLHLGYDQAIFCSNLNELEC